MSRNHFRPPHRSLGHPPARGRRRPDTDDEATAAHFGGRVARGSASPDHEPPPLEACARVVVVDGPDRLLEVPLQGTVLSIGRGRTADIVLSDSAVSRTHVILEQRGTAWIVCDSGSVNGVLINGRRLQEQQILDDGDEIEIGCTRLRFVSSSSQHPRHRRSHSTVGYPREHGRMAEGSSLPPPPRGPDYPYAAPSSVERDLQPARRMPPPPRRAVPASRPGQLVFDGHAAGEHLSQLSVDQAPAVPGYRSPAAPLHDFPQDVPSRSIQSYLRGETEKNSQSLIDKLNLTRRNVSFFAAGIVLSVLVMLPVLWALSGWDESKSEQRAVAPDELADPAAAIPTPLAPAAPPPQPEPQEPEALVITETETEPIEVSAPSESDTNLEPLDDDAEAAADNAHEEADQKASVSDSRTRAPRRRSVRRKRDNRPVERPQRVEDNSEKLSSKARAAYEDGAFERAQDLLYDASDAASSDADRRRLENKAIYVGKLATMHRIARRSEQDEPLVALAALEKALTLDRTLGGVHRARIRSDLQNLAVSSAKRFMARGERESARKAAAFAERHGAGRRVESLARSLDR